MCGGRQRQGEWFIDIYTVVTQGRAPGDKDQSDGRKAERKEVELQSLKSRVNR